MKRILMTHGHEPLNERLLRHLRDQGHTVALLFPTPEEALASDALTARVEARVSELGGLDVLVHGCELLDEPRLLTEDPRRFQQRITQALQRVFSVTRAAVSPLIRARGGAIVFPLLCDSLHYAGYPSSPVLDHAKLSMMKCLSRELMAFGIQVNALTLGYHDPGFTPAEKQRRREQLTIYGQKPRLAALEELLPALDFLVSPPSAHLGGQNIHVGLGIDTLV